MPILVTGGGDEVCVGVGVQERMPGGGECERVVMAGRYEHPSSSSKQGTPELDGPVR